MVDYASVGQKRDSIYREYDLDCIFKQNPVAHMSIKDYLIVCHHKLQVTDWSDYWGNVNTSSHHSFQMEKMKDQWNSWHFPNQIIAILQMPVLFIWYPFHTLLLFQLRIVKNDILAALNSSYPCANKQVPASPQQNTRKLMLGQSSCFVRSLNKI